MTDKTSDEILEGLYALVERAQTHRDLAEPPVQGRKPVADATPPDFTGQTLVKAPRDVANRSSTPLTVRFKGL